MSGMKIHSMKHARLEIDYLEKKGALDDKLEEGWRRPFKDVAEIAAWKNDLRTSAEPVFTPLQNYFEGRANRYRLLSVAGMVPLLGSAMSTLSVGVTSGGLLLGGLGLVAVLGSQMVVQDCAQQIAGLFSAKAELLRDAERMAIERERRLSAPPAPAPPAPAPTQPPAAAPAPPVSAAPAPPVSVAAP